MKKIVLILLLLLVGGISYADYSLSLAGGYGRYTKSAGEGLTDGGLVLHARWLRYISNSFSIGVQTGYTSFFSGTSGGYEHTLRAKSGLIVGQFDFMKNKVLKLYALGGFGLFLLRNDYEPVDAIRTEHFGVNASVGLEFFLSSEMGFVVDAQLQNVFRSMGSDAVVAISIGFVFYIIN